MKNGNPTIFYKPNIGNTPGGVILYTSGIYCIENIVNKKKYIGQSIDLENRKYEHFWMLKGNNHDNRHLQNSYNKYGENNFKFRVLLYCEPFELTKYEQIFVDYYTPELLYNVRLECVDSNQGIAFSEEAKEKMSKAKHGENHPMYGKHRSEETKRKISEAQKGKHPSKETRKKMSEAKLGENHPNYGKHCSEEAKKKMSEANSGKHHSEETRKKMSEAKLGKNHPMYGKHHSKEARKKMSEARRGKHPSEETRKKLSKIFSSEKGNNSKLMENQVFEILDLYYNKNKTQIDIAKIFLVNNATISYIVKGKIWESCYKEFMENSEK